MRNLSKQIYQIWQMKAAHSLFEIENYLLFCKMRNYKYLIRVWSLMIALSWEWQLLSELSLLQDICKISHGVNFIPHSCAIIKFLKIQRHKSFFRLKVQVSFRSYYFISHLIILKSGIAVENCYSNHVHNIMKEFIHISMEK